MKTTETVRGTDLLAENRTQ